MTVKISATITYPGSGNNFSQAYELETTQVAKVYRERVRVEFRGSKTWPRVILLLEPRAALLLSRALDAVANDYAEEVTATH